MKSAHELTLAGLSVENSWAFHAYAYGAFVLLGVITTLLGPLLPLLSSQWHLSSTLAGTLFTWQFGGATAGTLISALFLRGCNFRSLLIAGMALCSLGVAALALLPWPGLRYPIACYGFGLGVLIPAINLAVADMNPRRSASVLSTLNLCWTLGAIAGPTLLAFSRSSGIFLFSVAGIASVALFVGLWVPIPKARRVSYDDNFSSSAPNRFAILAVFGILFFAYVGTENAISGWITFYAVPVFHSAYRAMTVSSAFWAAFLVGRSIAPLIVQKWSDTVTVSTAIFAVILGLICLAASSGSAEMIAGAVLAGAGLAPVYPILISNLVAKIGATDPLAVICFAFSGVGAAVVPFVAGWTSNQSGHPLGGLSVSFLVLSVLLVVYLTCVPIPRKQPVRGA